MFARFGFADEDTNPVQLNISAGVGGRGLVPGRDDDTFGIGFIYTDIDAGIFTTLGLTDDVYGFEAFYNVAVGPGVQLGLDAQVIDQGLAGVDSATIFGARLNIRF